MNRLFRFMLFGIVIVAALSGCRPDPLANVPEQFEYFIPLGATAADARMIVALMEGNLDDCHKALKEGANVKITMKDGKTPLAYAVQANRREFIPLFLSQMTFEDVKDNFVSAARKGDDRMMQTLLESHLKGRQDVLQEALMEMAGSSDLQSIKEAPTYKDDDGRRLTDKARKALDLLLKNGAQINKGSIYGRTPLMEAAETNRAEMAYELLLRGADWKAKTDTGKTALDIARAGRYGDSLYGSIIPLLEAWQSGKHPKARGVKIAK
jgi:hypothetical protein